MGSDGLRQERSLLLSAISICYPRDAIAPTKYPCPLAKAWSFWAKHPDTKSLAISKACPRDAVAPTPGAFLP